MFFWNKKTQVFEALDAECPIPARISEPLRAIADAVGAEMDSCMVRTQLCFAIVMSIVYTDDISKILFSEDFAVGL